MQVKGEGRAKGKQTEVAHLKKIYLWKTETEMRRAQPPMKWQRKKPNPINIIYYVLSVVPVSLVVQYRGIVISTVL